MPPYHTSTSKCSPGPILLVVDQNNLVHQLKQKPMSPSRINTSHRTSGSTIVGSQPPPLQQQLSTSLQRCTLAEADTALTIISSWVVCALPELWATQCQDIRTLSTRLAPTQVERDALSPRASSPSSAWPWDLRLESYFGVELYFSEILFNYYNALIICNDYIKIYDCCSTKYKTCMNKGKSLPISYPFY